MVSSGNEEILEQLEAWVFDELKLVSYKALSLHCGIDADRAKQVLLEFGKQHQKRLQLTFFVSGRDKGPEGMQRVIMASESKLAQLRTTLAEITGLHVYAVRAISGNPTVEKPVADQESLDRELQAALWQCEARDILRALYRLSLAEQQPLKPHESEALAGAGDPEFLRRGLHSMIRNPNVSLRDIAAAPAKEAPVVYTSPRAASSSSVGSSSSRASSGSLQRSASDASKRSAAASADKKPVTKNATKKTTTSRGAPKSQISAMFARQLAEAEAKEANSTADLDDDDDGEDGARGGLGAAAMEVDTEEEDEAEDSDAPKPRKVDAGALMRSLQNMGKQSAAASSKKTAAAASKTTKQKQKQKKPVIVESEDELGAEDEEDDEEEEEDESDMSDYSRHSKQAASKQQRKKQIKSAGRGSSKKAAAAEPKKKKRRLNLDSEDDDDEDEVAGTQQPSEDEVTYSDLEDMGRHSDEEGSAHDPTPMQRFMRNVITTGDSARAPSMRQRRQVTRTYMKDGFLVCEEVSESDEEDVEEEDVPVASPTPAAAAAARSEESPNKLPQKRKQPEAVAAAPAAAPAAKGKGKQTKATPTPQEQPSKPTKPTSAAGKKAAGGKKAEAAKPKNTLLNYFK